jgi:Cysteine-rich secretory protein family
MRFLALLVASLVMAGSTVATAQQQSSTYVCPKCGKVHASGSSSTQSVTPVSYNAPSSNGASMQASSGISNVLDMLNSQRSRQGIHSLRYDPELQVVAERRAQQMAARGLKNHPPGSFAPGRYEGVGWSSSYSPSGVSACFTSDRRMQSAGAAMATGRDGVYFAVVYR